MRTKKFKLIIWLLVSIAIALMPWILLAQSTEGHQRHNFNLNKEVEDAIGYTQAVKVGNTLYISGSVGSGEMDKAVKQAYAELDKTLKAYHMNFAHVVKENVYTTNLEAFKLQQEFRKTIYAGNFPASTWVEVRQLYSPALIVEIELIAILE